MDKSRIDVLVGKRVQSARVQKGISVVQLSGMLDIDPMELNGLENGHVKWTVERLFLLSKIFSTSMDSFLEEAA